MADVTCPTGKHCYISRKEAARSLNYIKGGLGRYGMATFKCDRGDHYHHGHRKTWMPGMRRR